MECPIDWRSSSMVRVNSFGYCLGPSLSSSIFISVFSRKSRPLQRIAPGADQPDGVLPHPPERGGPLYRPAADAGRDADLYPAADRDAPATPQTAGSARTLKRHDSATINCADSRPVNACHAGGSRSCTTATTTSSRGTGSTFRFCPACSSDSSSRRSSSPRYRRTHTDPVRSFDQCTTTTTTTRASVRCGGSSTDRFRWCS